MITEREKEEIREGAEADRRVDEAEKEREEMFDAEKHRAILAARAFFLEHGFELEGDDAIPDSDYGSGGIVVQIRPLVDQIVKAMREHDRP